MIFLTVLEGTSYVNSSNNQTLLMNILGHLQNTRLLPGPPPPYDRESRVSFSVHDDLDTYRRVIL